MKIACVKKVFDPDGGGAEQYAANFAREFLQHGHKITVFAEKFNSNTTDDLEWIKINKPFLPSLCRTFSFHKNVQKIIPPENYDVVYSLSRTYPSSVFRVTEQLHAEWFRVYYGGLEKLNPRHRILLDLEKQIFMPENTRFVVTNSELAKKQVLQHYGYPESQIEVVRNGVDPHKFFPPKDKYERIAIREKLQIPHNKFVLLFAASNFKIKGLEQAIKVLAKLQPKVIQNTVYIILGGDDPAPFLKSAEKTGIIQNLEFRGHCANMREYYVASDLMLYPSLYEPFGNVCLEAFACGLPVLTTALNGSSEIITSGQNGYVVDNSDNIKDMVFYVEEFACLPVETQQLFSDSAFKASKSYTWEKHAARLEEIFLNIDDRVRN